MNSFDNFWFVIAFKFLKLGYLFIYLCCDEGKLIIMLKEIIGGNNITRQDFEKVYKNSTQVRLFYVLQACDFHDYKLLSNLCMTPRMGERWQC